MNDKGRRLGRGLDALLGDYGRPTSQEVVRPRAFSDNVAAIDPGPVRHLPIGALSANANNPRQDFDSDALEELAASIAVHGLVQPIAVRPIGDERFEIVAGERRWRAAQRSGLDKVPVFVLDLDERQALEVAIVENVQRTDLNPVEEACGYRALIEEFGYSQSELGEVIGKSRSHVANMLRLLKLPAEILDYLSEGRLSIGHARALITAVNPLELARRVLEHELNVRETERLVARAGETDESSPKQSVPNKDADTRAMERELSSTLGLHVDIRHKRSGKGELRIRYSSLEQFDLLRRRLGN